MTAHFDLGALQALLARGPDSALLRMSLALAYQQQGDNSSAMAQLEVGLRLEPAYAAAWRLLGLLEQESGEADAAMQAFAHGITAAEQRGDQQLRKELSVRLRRLQKQAGTAPEPAT